MTISDQDTFWMVISFNTSIISREEYGKFLDAEKAYEQYKKEGRTVKIIECRDMSAEVECSYETVVKSIGV